MTNDSHVEMQKQLWTKAFRELASLSIVDVRYHECIARELKDCIEEQLKYPCDYDLRIAELTGIAETLGQFLENEKAWFTAMLTDMKAENAARLAEQNN